jgi:hypothetical protein
MSSDGCSGKVTGARIYMFGKKKKDIGNTLIIISDGNVLYDGPVHSLPIKEARVIEGSIEFYDDPEPCMIHRGAVISRYYTMIDKWISECDPEEERSFEITDFPEHISSLLEL